MSPSSDFHVVLIPGAWHTAKSYDSLLPYLDTAGYSTTALTLASVNADHDIPDTTEDITLIRNHLVDLLSAEPTKKIILVMHSYSGVPGTDACEDLSYTHRQSQNLPGGVVGLVYLAACLVLPGETVMTVRTLVPPSPEKATIDPMLSLDFDPSTGTARHKNPIPEFYADLTPEQQATCVAQLGSHSMGVFAGALTYPAYVDIPSWYLLCTEDKTLSLKVQEVMAQRVKDFGGKMQTRKAESGHTVFVRRPEAVVELVDLAAGRADSGA